MLTFDLRTPDLAFEFVLNMLNMTGRDFTQEYFVNCNHDFEELWRKNYHHLKTIHADEIKIMAFHITASLDDCESIKENGIHNLQEVLSCDSIMNQMLSKYGVQINIDECTLVYKGRVYNIDYADYKGRFNLHGIDKHLSSISYRIYYDFTVNGFLCCDNVFSYGTNIHLRPEFILDLVNAFPDLQIMQEEWINLSNSYRIDYFAYVDQLHRFNFSLDEYRDPPCEEWDQLNDNDKIVKWMLFHAIDRAYDELGQTYLYLKDDLSVPPEQIISCQKL